MQLEEFFRESWFGVMKNQTRKQKKWRYGHFKVSASLTESLHRSWSIWFCKPLPICVQFLLDSLCKLV